MMVPVAGQYDSSLGICNLSPTYRDLFPSKVYKPEIKSDKKAMITSLELDSRIAINVGSS